MKAIIMAGGEGTRLRPLSCDRPKPMVPVANRPVMEYAIELLRDLGITEIGVTLQYLPQEIIDYFGEGKRWGVKLSYFIEDIPLGTAGSVKNAGDFLDRTFLVVSGDALTDLNLAEAIRFHQDKQAIATLVLTSVTNPLEYGVVITNPDGSIQRFLEKPGWGEVFSDWVNTGIYVLEPEALDYFPSGEKYDFSKDLFPRLLSDKKPIYGCLLNGYWCDIGSLEQYLNAHKDILDGKVRVSPGGTLINDGSKGPLLIGNNCAIGKGVELGAYTILGDNVVIEEQSTIKRSVLWDNVYVGKKASISGALVGEKVTIKDNVAIYQDAAIGDGTYINSRVTIKPRVKVWPCKSINTGAIVSESFVWGQEAKRSLFSIEGVTGLINRDITPELAAKLGASCGSILDKGSHLAVSCDGRTETSMLKLALTSGLLSSGAKVSNLGTLTMPVHRFAVAKLGAFGGVHIKADYNNPQKCWVQFVDAKGININRELERKIEGIYAREEFRRVSSKEIERIIPIKDSLSAYLNNLLISADLEAIKSKRFKILVDTGNDLLNYVFKELSLHFHFELVGLDYVKTEKEGFSGQLQRVDRILEEVKSKQLDLGIILDSNGERVVLVDSTGRVLDEHLFTVLMALVLFKANQGGTVVVPITASETIEAIAAGYNATVVRTKTAPWAVMSELVKDDILKAQKPYSQFFIQNDALYAVVMLLDFISREEVTLNHLLEEIPSFYLSVTDTDCPWEEKGRVMRALIAEETKRRVELLDGVKIRHDNGWALVLPHSEEPKYQIYSEGMCQESAKELGVFYDNKIKEMLQN